jgi:hypothetical protein
MYTEVLRQICEAYEQSSSAASAANLMYDIARMAQAQKTGNIFERVGEFLVNNADKLDKKFEQDYSYGSPSLIPNVPKFIWAEFQKYNRNDTND